MEEKRLILENTHGDRRRGRGVSVRYCCGKMKENKRINDDEIKMIKKKRGLTLETYNYAKKNDGKWLECLRREIV